MESFIKRVEGKSQSEQFCGKSIRNMNDDGLELDVTSAHCTREQDQVALKMLRWMACEHSDNGESVGSPTIFRAVDTHIDQQTSSRQSMEGLLCWGRHDIGSLPISVFDSITVRYYVNAVYGADISGSFVAAWDSNRRREDKISAGPNVKRRRDCILFRYPERKSRVSSTMDGLSVGRVRIFFKVGDEYKKSTKAGHHLSLAT